MARLSHARRTMHGSFPRFHRHMRQFHPVRQFHPAQLSHMRQFHPARLSHVLMGCRSRSDARPFAEGVRGTVPYLDRSPNRER